MATSVGGEGTHKGCPYGMDNDVIYNPDIHHRKSIRLDGYDYSGAGAYFISVVAQGRLCLFGSVVDGELRLNDAGKMVRRVWDGMPDRFPLINMDEFVVMPNHVHGVIFIHQPAPTTGATSRAPAGGRAPTRGAPTLGDVVGAFKSVTTVEYSRGVREMGWQRFDKRLWQRNYFERVIRNDSELGRTREYIANNIMNWESDRENPSGTISSAG